MPLTAPSSRVQVQIQNTFNVARLVGLEAAKRRVKAYVRLQQPFYECKEKGSHDEKEDVKPDGVLGTWWHETLRMLASIDGCVRFEVVPILSAKAITPA